jgi:4-hydroxy-3-methylbut-2-en-1-yl diphosphate synthase IspG/GcpE
MEFVKLQIAIMGCIVNGPGEMADADFGYVGGAPGKIDLYVGKVCLSLACELTWVSHWLQCKLPPTLQSPAVLILIWVSWLYIIVGHQFHWRVFYLFLQQVVKRGIAMEKATDALIELIKENGRWIEPELVEN